MQSCTKTQLQIVHLSWWQQPTFKAQEVNVIYKASILQALLSIWTPAQTVFNSTFDWLAIERPSVLVSFLENITSNLFLEHTAWEHQCIPTKGKCAKMSCPASCPELFAQQQANLNRHGGHTTCISAAKKLSHRSKEDYMLTKQHVLQHCRGMTAKARREMSHVCQCSKNTETSQQW